VARLAKAGFAAGTASCAATGGHAITVRYTGNGGIYPTYLCNDNVAKDWQPRIA